MTDQERLTAISQAIYLARYNQESDVTGVDLTDFQNQTIGWVNQYLPELEKARNPNGSMVDWNFLRTNDAVIGTVATANTISYALAPTIRKLVVSPYRDVTIRQDGTVVSTFKLVNPNQINDPTDHDIRDRSMVLKRNLIFSRSLNPTEVGGDVVADTIAFAPRLSQSNVAFLTLLDDYPDIYQLVVLGVIKNQVLPDIVQGGLTPSFSQKYDSYLADCIEENNASADASDVVRESFAWVGGVGF